MKYLNTDLDLVSAENLTELAGALEARGVFALHATQDADGFWRASLESERQYPEPEPCISAILDVVESLNEPHRRTWQRCSKREFNVGYECAAAVLTQSLSADLIVRVASAGASVGLTLYPGESAS